MKTETFIQTERHIIEENGKPQGYPGRWVGRFIWDHGERVPRHYHLMARRTFELRAIPQDGLLRIAVCDRYRLYVNGVFVGRGVTRITRPQWMPYDTYEIASLLQPGKNTLAVMAHHYGSPNNYTADLPSGIFVELAMKFPGDASQLVTSDAEWRVCAMKGYRRDTPVLNGWHGIANEFFDASQDPIDWMMPEFDDTSWETAKVLNAHPDPMNWAAPESPWTTLEPRRVPKLRERRVPVTRIMKTAEVIEESIDVVTESDIHERLTKELHVPLEQASIIDAERLIASKGAVRMSASPAIGGRNARSPVVIVDFGRPLFGCPEMTLTAPAGAVIDLFYANALMGEGAECRPVPDIMLHIGDRLITRAGQQTWQLSDTRQFRYLQIVVRATTVPVMIEQVEFISLEYPADARGSFACSDPVLTRVWEAGVNTLYLHMEDTHVIDATRERRQYPAYWDIGHRAIYAAYGDRLLAEELLLATKRMQLPDGQLEKYSGSHGDIMGFPPLPYAINSFSQYQFPNGSSWFAPSVWEHYLRFGNPGLLALHYPVLERLCEFYESFAVYEGLIYNLNGMLFMDWAKHELRGANLSTNIGYVVMLDTMASIAAELGKPERERLALTERATEIRTKLRELYWNEERGLFTDSLIDGQQSPIFSVLTNTYALFGKIADDRQIKRILERVFDPTDPITRPTPLIIGSIAAALIEAGAVDDTLAMLSAKFGPVIKDMDVPTLSEAWVDQSYSGASRGAIHDQPCLIMCTMHEQILGVRPISPNFSRCRIQPRLGLLPWANGSIPTPHGDIHVSYEQSKEGVLKFEVQIPRDIESELILVRPSGEMTLTINGRKMMEGNNAAVQLKESTIHILLEVGLTIGELRSM